MRELEQAKFSLELLKVRATGGEASSPSEERRWSLELVPPVTPPLLSPQGTPDSQSSKGSFELLSMDEEPPKAVEEVTDSDEPCSPPPSVPEPDLEVVPTSRQPEEPQRAEVPEVTPPGSQGQSKMDPAAVSAPTHPPKIENYLPTFYVPASEGSPVVSSRPAEEPRPNTEAAASTANPAVTKPLRERRPVVVVISMQKETPLSEELSEIFRPPVELRDSAAQTGGLTPSPQKPEPAAVPQGPVPASTSVPQADPAVIEKLVRLNEEKEERQRNRRQQNEKEMMEQIRQQKEVLERQRLHFVQYERDMFEKQREEALHRIQLSRQGGQDAGGTQTSGKPLRPSSLTPHARTQSDSTAPSARSPPAVDIRGSAPYPQLPPPPASAPRGKPTERAAEGWAPNSRNMKDKTGNIFFSPKDKVTFTPFDKDAVTAETPVTITREGPAPVSKTSKAPKARDVGRVGQKKKARMARTRSDFLTRAPIVSIGGDSDEDGYDRVSPLTPRHFSLPLSKQGPAEGGLRETCFSDSDMPATSEEQKKIQKAMSSGDLVKVDSMRKNSQDGRVRGKMRFWGKSKYGDKKSSREKLICGADTPDGDYGDFGDTGPLLGEGQENMSPPCSPDPTLDRGFRDLKENKEPSPKVKRRRSVKISSVAMESAQCQNDALQILTCTSDYRSMNDFLMKKINDLDTEDSKKDTMVDVVFKKA
ncbi:unnamed protein product [Pleuronectes platessa]|uniref:Uncharacterized protein n=1 Tax=Pleuronectes platessa TaxID=8262 RepID=A0A9N7UZK3_PLEPL|nr:unnamed protein product [Pleuronectes platessa]